MPCRYESETIRALHSGTSSEFLLLHQQSCAACRGAVVLAQALRNDAIDLTARYTPPPSALVLAAAERHRRVESLARATRVLGALRIAGLAYAAIFLLWGLHSLAGHGSAVLQGLDSKSLSATLEGTGIAVLFVASGAWYALRREERRTI